MWTALARLAILVVSFRRLAPWLGRTMGSTPDVSDEAADEVSREVQWAVRVASRHVPWDAKCLVQAVAARAMLGRRRLSGTIYFGVAKEGEELKAHAWVRTGTRVVTGAREMLGFTVVSTFAFGPECAE